MNVLKIKNGRVEIIDNIVFIHVNDNAEFDVADMLVLFQFRKKILGENRYGVLLISGEHSTITNEARKLAALPEHAYLRQAFAMVVHSLSQRIIGNLYIKFDKPPSPTRLFTNEEKARAWVTSYVNSEVEM
jgi:hypothetical protein